MQKRIGLFVAIAAIVAIGWVSVSRKVPDGGQPPPPAPQISEKASPDPAISTSTDKFTGFKKTEMRPIQFGPEHGFRDLAYDQGHAAIDVSFASGDGAILMIVESSANHRQFVDGADVHVLADGARISLGHFATHRSTRETELGGVVFNDTIGGPISRGDLEKIAAANAVEIRIGSYEAALRSSDIERIRAFANTTR